MWEALRYLHNSHMFEPSKDAESKEFLRYVEINKKFAGMQFIRNCIVNLYSKTNDFNHFMMEID